MRILREVRIIFFHAKSLKQDVHLTHTTPPGLATLGRAQEVASGPWMGQDRLRRDFSEVLSAVPGSTHGDLTIFPPCPVH